MRTTRTGESALLLLDAVAVLRAQSIPYAVIGAMAVAVHGTVRASLDADALVSLAIRDASKLGDNFAAAGFLVEVRKGDYDDPIGALIELRDDFDNRVDLLVGLKGAETSIFSRAIEIGFAGESLRVVSREDLIAMKLYAGGPKDLLDAKQLWSNDPSTLNLNLLERLADRYGTKTLVSLRQLQQEMAPS